NGVEPMHIVGWLVISFCLMAQSIPALAQHRELGAHEHGKGTLNIAVEGTRLSMELEVPGADILGFEHAAKTGKDKAAVDAAKKQLSTPLALFKLPAAAGCVVKDADVKVEAEEHDQDHDKVAKDSKAAPTNDHDDRDHEHGHSQFHAQYALDCTTPASIAAIDFDYFRSFPGAQKLEVNLITPKGQSKYEVTRANPRIDLAGMM
ncbi:MAG: DUF2796 domain-containing protein, partial [Bacteroidota bacterium]